MSLEPVAWLCKGARDLPKEVKREIAYYGQHPWAPLIKELRFEYGPVAYEPLSKFLYIHCPYPTKWHAPGRGQPALGQYCKKFFICRSIYNPDYSELPDWVVRSLTSPDEQKNTSQE